MLRILILFVTMMMAASAKAVTEPTQSAQFDELLTRFYEADQFNGSMAVMVGNEVVYQGSRGLADKAAARENGPETRFRVASLTKPFTALVIMDLYEDGLIELDVPVARYLPSAEYEQAEEFTIQDLLAHVSGLKREAIEDSDDNELAIGDVELYERIFSAPLETSPGTQYAYSNAGYVLLRLIAENVSGRSFATLIETRITRPAGMTNTGLELDNGQSQDLSLGYDILLGEPVLADRAGISQNGYGAMGIYTSVTDVIALTRALHSDQILEASTRSLMERRHGMGRGLGWTTLMASGVNSEGETIYAVGHNGDWSGVNASYLRFEPDGFAVVFLSNQNQMDRNGLVGGVIAILNDADVPEPRVEGADEILRIVVTEGVEHGLERTRELTELNGVSPLPHSMRVLAIGNMLIREERRTDARRVFEFMVQAFPDAMWGRLALGSLELDAGKIEDARILFDQVMVIDPGNTFALDYLDQIAETH